MAVSFRLPIALALILLIQASLQAEALALVSPDEQNRIDVTLTDQGEPAFEVSRGGVPLASGWLGLEFADSGLLGQGLKIVGSRRSERDETYAIPVGKTSSARDHHNELIVSLEEIAPPHRKLDLAFRAFDDGITFRYLIPEQESLSEFILTDEHTRFSFAGNPTAKALPLKNFTTPYEWYYETKPVSALKPDQLIYRSCWSTRRTSGFLSRKQTSMTTPACTFLPSKVSQTHSSRSSRHCQTGRTKRRSSVARPSRPPGGC